jgi:hypothetical protein
MNSVLHGSGAQVPPSQKHVKIYFIQAGHCEKTATEFYRHYAEKRWINPDGNLIADWKRCAWQWIWNR